MGQGYQPIIEARWNEKCLINFRNIAQKQLPPLEWVDPVGPGVRWTIKNKILLCKPTARSSFCLLAPAQISKLIPPFGGVGPAGPGVRWAPQNKVLLCKPTQGTTFVCLLPLNCLSYYPHLVGWTLRAQGWSEPPTNRNLPGKPTPRSNFCLVSHTQLFKQIPLFGGVDPVGVSPPQIKFSHANPPQGATFVCWPLPYSYCKHLHLVGWTLRAQGWSELPKNRNLPGKPTPRREFCLLDPTQLITLQGISDGVIVRGTPGADILGRPLAWCLIS